jgi:putative ABC transport system permease protein
MITVAVAITVALLVVYLLIYGLTTHTYRRIVDEK